MLEMIPFVGNSVSTEFLSAPVEEEMQNNKG